MLSQNDGALEKFLQKRFREEASKITYNGDNRGVRKKKAAPPPLAIEHLHGFNRLTAQEKEVRLDIMSSIASYISLDAVDL